MIEEGYRFITVSNDVRLMATRASEEVGAVRKIVGKAG